MTMDGEEIKDQQLPVEWIGPFRYEFISFHRSEGSLEGRGGKEDM
jgi:hypothetical protein